MPKKSIELPPNKCWQKFTKIEKEKWKSHIKSLSWKSETGTQGPVWVVFKEIAQEKGQFWESNIMRNYEDSNMTKSDGGYYCEWFTYAKASTIAKQMGVNFESH